MKRRRFLLLTALCAGCARRETPPEALLPESLEGGWRRTGIVTVGAEGASELLRGLGLRLIYRGAYQGPATAEVTVYVMAAPTSAFEAAQKWRPAPDSVFFYQEQYFVHVGWANADRNAVGGLVRGLERNLKALGR